MTIILTIETSCNEVEENQDYWIIGQLGLIHTPPSSTFIFC